MDVGDSEQKTITLVIKTPNQAQEDQTVKDVYLNWTVNDLKTRLSAVYPTNPVSYNVTAKLASVLMLAEVASELVRRVQLKTVFWNVMTRASCQ